MLLRIGVAGVLGAVAMFIWTAIAHMATPLGFTGFSQLSNEGPTLSAIHASAGDKPGLYIYPWADPASMNSKQGRAAYAAKTQSGPSGLLLYHPPGVDPGMTTGMLVEEFIKQLVVCLIAAFLLAEAKLAKLWERAGFVAAIGAVASLETNASYRIWYLFPGDYTAAQITTSFISYVIAGFAIGWWLKPKAPKQAAA
jgi:hypothetical protein